MVLVMDNRSRNENCALWREQGAKERCVEEGRARKLAKGEQLALGSCTGNFATARDDMIVPKHCLFVKREMDRIYFEVAGHKGGFF